MKKEHPDIEILTKANAIKRTDYNVNFGSLDFHIFPILERCDHIHEGKKYVFCYLENEFSNIKTITEVTETHVFTVDKYGIDQKISIDAIDAIFEVKSMDRFLMPPNPATLN